MFTTSYFSTIHFEEPNTTYTVLLFGVILNWFVVVRVLAFYSTYTGYKKTQVPTK